MWPAVIVQQLFPILPEGYVAAPRVYLGSEFEIDVSTYKQLAPAEEDGRDDQTGGVAVATWAPPKPTLTLETELPDQDEYEVRVYDARHGRRLVAAIEIVSPSTKDRPESRRAFVAKAAALLQRGVSVSIVDVVTVRHFNLYADLLELIDRTDPMLGADAPPLYSVTARGRKRARRRSVLESWFYPMAIGETLPVVPIWLDVDLGVLLDLEPSYEETCRVLRI